MKYSSSVQTSNLSAIVLFVAFLFLSERSLVLVFVYTFWVMYRMQSCKIATAKWEVIDGI